MAESATRDAEAFAQPSLRAVFALPVACLSALATVHFGELDEPLFRLLNDTAPASTNFWRHVTLLGEGLVVLALCAPAIRHRPRWLFAALLAAIFALAGSHLLKTLFEQDRPLRLLEDVQILVRRLTKHSFPSGHATTAFAVAGLALLGGAPRWLALAALPLAAVVALSRVAVGVHWPRDVLAGAALGWLCACAAIALAARWQSAARSPLRQIVAALPLLAGIALLVDPPDPVEGVTAVARIIAVFGIAVGGAFWLGTLRGTAVRNP